MPEYTVVYCNTQLHGHPPCWRLWAKRWDWYDRGEYATEAEAQRAAQQRNEEWAQAQQQSRRRGVTQPRLPWR